MRQLFKSPPPSVIALLLQLCAFAITQYAVEIAEVSTSPMLLAWSYGVVAATLSLLFGLAKWWLLIQLLFAPTIVFMLGFELPPSLSLAAFVILLVVYWSTFRTQVPLYLSSNKVWDALENLLPETDTNHTLKFIDLGSGLGGVLTHLAKARPEGFYVGVETAPLPFIWSWLRIRLGSYRNCQVVWGDLWDADLSQYDVVFAYLSPVPMQKLWLKAQKEMRSGSILISSTFTIPNHAPDKTVTVDDLHHSTLLVWHM
jgi:hypothetical protein